MKILHLVLKKQWFDMIASGEKLEEYREIKEYWCNRLLLHCGKKKPVMFWMMYGFSPDEIAATIDFEEYDAICFQCGYKKNAPRITVECKGVSVGPAKPEWSGNWKGQVFIIKLGGKIESI